MNPRTFAWIMVVAVGVYLILLGQLAIRLIGTGDGVAIAMGVGILAFPVIGVWLLWREMRFGYRMQFVAHEWQKLGTDPAQLTYEECLPRVEAAPQEWQPWFELGLAYEKAGDRRRARAAMREAERRFPG